MIIVLFGQPHSGKTTLAAEFSAHNIDGDKLRELFSNKDYSREGRIKNLNRASDIAHYMNESTDKDIILSLVYPYQEARDYLNSLTKDVIWIYLTYNEERGRESFHVKDFDLPHLNDLDLMLNTSVTPKLKCINKIKKIINEKHISRGE